MGKKTRRTPPLGCKLGISGAEGLSCINPIRFTCHAVSCGAHITPSIFHVLHVGNAQHMNWQQAAVQGFSF